MLSTVIHGIWFRTTDFLNRSHLTPAIKSTRDTAIRLLFITLVGELLFLCLFVHLPVFVYKSCNSWASSFLVLQCISVILNSNTVIVPMWLLGLITWHFITRMGNYLEAKPFIFAKSNLKTFSFCSQVKSLISTFFWVLGLKNLKKKSENVTKANWQYMISKQTMHITKL